MLHMTKMMQIITCFSLFAVLGHSEIVTQSSNATTVKSQTEEKGSLGAFEKLQWETDMDHAFERAKKEHKNVMVMVEDTHCKWCIKMKKDTLSDQKIQDKLQSYILLKVQRSDKKTAKRIEDFSGAIPSFYFMEPDKELIESVIGYFITEDFLGYLQDIEEEN